MTTLQAQRIVKVIVGPPGDFGKEIGGLASGSLRIEFSVPKTSKKEPNKAKIKLYNLDPTTAALIESDEARNSIKLFAGYGGTFGGGSPDESGAPGLIFSGEIRRGKAKTVLAPPHRITTIEANDGGSKYRSARMNKSYNAGITAFRLIDDIARSFNVTISVPDDIRDQPIEEGLVATGPSRDILSSLGDSLGFEWYFEDDELKIVALDGDNGEEAFLLTPETGLIGSPEKTDKGVNVVSLLNPALRVRRIVRVESRDTTGWFRIQSLEHHGDSYDGNDFTTNMECKAVTAGKSPTAAAKKANEVRRIRLAVINAGLMFPSLAAAVAKAAAPEFGFGNVFIAEFSPGEYGLVTRSESVKLQSKLSIFERNGDLIFV